MVNYVRKEENIFACQNSRRNHSELLTHGHNGQFRERDSLGNYPFPPRG